MWFFFFSPSQIKHWTQDSNVSVHSGEFVPLIRTEMPPVVHLYTKDIYFEHSIQSMGVSKHGEIFGKCNKGFSRRCFRSDETSTPACHYHPPPIASQVTSHDVPPPTDLSPPPCGARWWWQQSTLTLGAKSLSQQTENPQQVRRQWACHLEGNKFFFSVCSKPLSTTNTPFICFDL